MNRILKITGLIALEVVIVASLVALAVATLWLFRKGIGANWSTLAWISVLVEGIGALVIIPFALITSIEFTKDRIHRIKCAKY